MLSEGTTAPIIEMILAVIDEIANFLLEMNRRFIESWYWVAAAPR